MENLRKEFLTILNGAVLAEREACAKLADAQVPISSSALRIAAMIRARPPFNPPPMALETSKIRVRDLIAPRSRRGGK